MEALVKFLDGVRLVMFLGLGFLALFHWLRNRGKSEFWIAATFVTLGLVVLAGAFIPDEAEHEWHRWAQKAVVTGVVLFPYFLFRFTETFRAAPRWIEVAGGLATFGVALGPFLLRSIPQGGEPRTMGFQIFLFAFLTQWVFLTLVVITLLWTGGRGQATVTRNRMRTLSLGAIGLAMALVVSAATPGSGDVSVANLVTELLAITSVPLFVLGFAPPGPVLAHWRRSDQDRLRVATAGLVRANDAAEVADSLLPPLVSIVGGTAASLIDHEGTTIGGYRRPDALSALVPQIMSLPMQAGSLVIETSRYSPYFNKDVTGLLKSVASLADIALERIRLTESERQGALELRGLHETMSEFLLAASHDLRTPIAVVKGFSSTMLQRWSDIDDASKVEYLTVINRQSDHLSRLVDDMMTASRLDVGALEVSPEIVDLRALVAETVGDLYPDTPVQIDVAADLTVRADPDHLRRIVRNYVENALNYGEAPFTVDAEVADGFVRVKVTDHGSGVDPLLMSNLFQRFARGSQEGKLRVGTGLGLSIVKGLARANGGDTWYEANDPCGACFGVTVPIA